MSNILDGVRYLDFVMLLCNSSTCTSLTMLRVWDAPTIHDLFSKSNQQKQQNNNTVLGFQTELYYLQANGPLLLPLALGHLPVISFPTLPLTTTRQCSLEEPNKDADNIAEITESMTVFLWILSQWYAQRD